MNLKRNELEKYEENIRDIKDRRKKISRAVFSYIDVNTGEEYRRAFFSKPFTPEQYFWDVAPEYIMHK